MKTQTIGKRFTAGLKGVVLGAVAAGVVLLGGCGGDDEGGGGGGGDKSSGSGSGSTKYTLNLKSEPTGSGSFVWKPDGAQFNSGDSVTVTVSSSNPEKYTFIEWTGVDASVAKDSSVKIVMKGNKTLTAKFSAKYSITPVVEPAGAGKVTLKPDSALYPAGTTVTLSASPVSDSGYFFIGWAVKGSIIEPDVQLLCTVNSDTTITAKFLKKYKIILTKNGTGNVTLDPPGPYYDDGTKVTLTATPEDNFVSWRQPNGSLWFENDIDKSSDPTLTITIDKANVELTARFK